MALREMLPLESTIFSTQHRKLGGKNHLQIYTKLEVGDLGKVVSNDAKAQTLIGQAGQMYSKEQRMHTDKYNDTI